MSCIQKIVFYIFISLVFINGICNLIFPEKVIVFRSKLPLGVNWLSGGFFYGTEIRIRVVGLILVILSIFLFLLMQKQR